MAWQETRGTNLGATTTTERGLTESEVRQMIRESRRPDFSDFSGGSEGGVPLVDPGRARDDPNDVQGEITRAQYEDTKKRFQPLIKELAGKATDPELVEDRAHEAGLLAQSGISRTAAAQQRALARTGRGLTAEEQGALQHRQGLQAGLDVTTAENTTRRQLRERNLAVLEQLNKVGKGVKGTSEQGLSTAASLQTQRKNAADAAKAGQPSKGMSVASGVATGAMMGSMIGPWGTVIGGVLGGLAGLF